MTLSGNAGLYFNLSESNIATGTGTVSQTYTVESSVGNITLSTSDVVYTLYGVVGANSYQLNLNSINSISGAGTGIDMRTVRNEYGDYNNIKYFVVHNTDTTKSLTLKPGATSSYFAASEQITLKPGMGVGLAYGYPETVGATSSVISIVGSAGSTQHEIYILGN